MLDELAARGVAVDTGQDTWVCRGVYNDVDGWQRLKVGRHADVGVVELDAERANDRAVLLASRAHEVVETDQRMHTPLDPLAKQGGPHEPAGAGNENLHETSLCCQAWTICAIVCSRLTVMSQPG